ncbi:amino acid adenylation domain-containing protein [Actinoplanes sp. NPDC023936]|uniref:amino acid adenylation domain-containing protein n=1 Tax=Actinoplanes sp. NPDC023936 TaxID=3154910 RepID=UPI0033D95517
MTTPVHLDVFDAARRHGDATAIAGDVPVTYTDLIAAASRLATRLNAQAPPGRPVAVLSAKRPSTVVAFLAVLATGRAYLPVDPAMPADRRAFILRDAGCGLVLAGGGDDLSGCGVPVLTLPADPRDIATGDRPSEPAPIDPDSDAYLLYTSGSTGTPKGVRITHRNAAAFVGWAAGAFPLKPEDAVAVHAPLHFDLPVYDLYAGLSAGATLHLVDERTALFPQALLDFLRRRRITALYAVPSALTALIHRTDLADAPLDALRQLLYAGEEFRPEPLARLWAALPNCEVANLYGPIETNVITSYRLDRADLTRSRIPIGHPAGDVSLRVADDGELLVAGDCVTPGYLNRPELNEKAFRTIGGRRFYRTGDHVRRDPDGLLHLLGRRDGLVKTRGYRVELGEVESAIGRHPGVAEVAVIARPDDRLTHTLHAFVAGREGGAVTAGAVLRHCREQLPGYMVPATVAIRSALPRTSTGKIARAELLGLPAENPAEDPENPEDPR